MFKNLSLTLFFLITLTGFTFATDCDCSRWLAGGQNAGGYCVDHIQDKMTEAGLGTRPTGNAGTWPGNIEETEVQIGDVGIFAGNIGHVFWTEEIIERDNDGNPTRIRISEKNWGVATGDPIEDCCVVTVNYNVVTYRTINVSDVDRFWRPSRSNTSSTSSSVAYRIVGNLAWYPPYKSCVKAESWVYFYSGYPKGGMSIANNSICEKNESEVKNAFGLDGLWWELLYSEDDLEEICR